jgi:hypothetical protein
VHHFGVLVSGRLRVRDDDGQEMDFGPDDVVIFRQDMTAGLLETSLQFSIGSHIKQTRSKKLVK